MRTVEERIFLTGRELKNLVVRIFLNGVIPWRRKSSTEERAELPIYLIDIDRSSFTLRVDKLYIGKGGPIVLEHFI
jgi:hypothetical protein